MTDWMQLIMAASPESGAPPPPYQGWIVLLVVMVVLFYLMLIRPQKREQQDKKRMMATLERGDRVVTIGGIHGTVASVDAQHNTVTVDVGKNVKIEFSRNAISSVEKKTKKAAEESKPESA